MSKAPEGDIQVNRQNITAERAVLGTMLIDNDTIDAITEILSAGDFYRETHVKLFRVMVELHGDGSPVDLVTVHERLSIKGMIEEVGGIGYFSGLPDDVPVTVNVLSYARIVAECAHVRKITGKAQALALMTGTSSPSEIYEAAIKLARESEPREARKSNLSGKVAMTRLSDMVDRARVGQSSAKPIPTPWPGLTELLKGGWTGGHRPYYIGARRKVGKTSAALEIAVNAVRKRGACVVFFELELDLDKTMLRLVASQAQIPMSRLESGNLAGLEGAYTRIVDDCFTDRFQIDASRFEMGAMGKRDRVKGSRTIEAIRRTIARIRTEQAIDLVIIDHLQKIEPPFNCAIFDRVSMASAGIAEIAQETGIPIVCMVQLNDGDGAPTMDDVRGSKEINNDCEALILLDRPATRASQKEQAKMSPVQLEDASLSLVLHGSGPTGQISMRYQGDCLRWSEVGGAAMTDEEWQASIAWHDDQ